jgi:bifunctional non-homologous end joining protein LigD
MAARRRKPAELADAQLQLYRSMRDFAITSEPAGKAAAKVAAKSARLKQANSGPLPFVIQKHAATRLHYDFRLGWNGVLKSWAIAKGPSYRTSDKRLAVQVEDHPIDYGGFEGIIPKGQYGGGTVMLWDTGTWEPQAGHTDVDEGLRTGSLKFTLHGTKLKGNWTLVRMSGKAANEKKPNWLLIKEHDDFERGETDPAITEESPNSAVTKRSLEEIARQEDHVWNSKAAAHQTSPTNPAAASSKTQKNQPTPKLKIRLNACPKEALPKFIPPQLATQADQPPPQSGWLHELKLDGYRIQARKNKAQVKLLTRTGLDWTHRMKAIAAEVTKLPVESAILDGEVVVLSADGTTSFANLQASFREGASHPLTYFVFDLLHLNGRNLRGLELIQRKQILASLFAESDSETLRLNEHTDSNGDQVFRSACDLHAEGIISKRASGAYISGRTSSWLKIKCGRQQEFVIGGFTLPSNGIDGVGALLLGYYDGRGKLIYAGRTGTGFTQKTHRLIRDQLEKLRAKTAPFESISSADSRGVVWVTPKLVTQVSFTTWTADNLVRQAAFKGIREDKPAKDVRREEPLHFAAKSPSTGVTAGAAHATQSRTAAKVVAPPRSGSIPDSPMPSTDEHAAIRLTHPDKILDSESKLTKQQLADYYWQIADHMLPQIANRPLSLVRCPEGSTQPCFFQKHTSPTLPPGIETVQVPDKKTGKPEPYITLSTREALAGLAQMGVLELHPWGAQNNNLEHPDRIVIDLDPDESITWPVLAAAATQTRSLLKKLSLESFLKSTGGKGLHIVVPIIPEHDWAAIKQFAHAIALRLEKEQPDLYLTKMSKAARKGRIFIDYLRNERGATAVAAFSPRARAGAPVSIPLSWSELDQSQRPIFHVAGFDSWKDRLKRDPWEKLPQSYQKIDIEKAAKLL